MSTKPLMREMPNISGLDFIDKIMTIEKLLREDKMLDIFHWILMIIGRIYLE